MTNADDDRDRTTPSGAFFAAARHAQHAMDSAKGMVAGADLDQLRSKAADAASAVYREGRELLASDEVAKAKDQLSESIRKNPLAAVGIAFTAGLLIALLTRG
jgi:ElaB/YqjD/DUF883 family membrane-anchored ribosome-binding protein